MTNLPALVDILNPIFRTRGTADWLARLEAVGLPAGPVLTIPEMHRDPQALARGVITEVEHSRLGPVKTIGLPIAFSGTPGGPQSGAPFYGEHTAEVLTEDGYSEAEIADMLASGAAVGAA